MSKVKDGDIVKVHYTGKLKNGKVFDTSEGNEPIEFKIGDGKIIPKFEESVVGMEIGDKKTITVPNKEAYGTFNQDLVAVVKKEHLPKDLNLEIGQKLQINPPEKNPFVVRISEIKGEDVTLDGNHPLAGEDLTFNIELVAIT